MGGAIAAALTQPLWVMTLIFSALALGLALPFLMLLVFPSIAQRLPRPGIWMTTLRRVMGVGMLLSVLWLVWVLAAEGGSAMMAASICLSTLGVLFWGYGKLSKPTMDNVSHQWARVMLVIMALCVAGCIWQLEKAEDARALTGATASSAAAAPQNTPQGSLVFAPYSKAAVDAALKSGRPVLINFTARWCLTCQINKRMALDTERVRNIVTPKNIALFEADWTHHDETITQAIASFGYNSIPLLVYYPGRVDQGSIGATKPDKPVILSAIFTENELVALLTK
jgi:thiol:disulfide interchange protein DsbD